jgi:DNA-binding transcriptional MocR family regulator
LILRDFFGSASEENIRKGIARLGNVLKKFV